MPESNEVYDPDTNTWMTVGPESWIDVTTPNSDDADYPEPDDNETLNYEPILTDDCATIGKRHKYKNRETGEISDTCLKCGRPRAAQTAKKTTSISTGSRRSSKNNMLDMLLGGLWYGAGSVVKNNVPGPGGTVAGKVMQLEAGIAGPKLHNALKRTPLYPYIQIAQTQVGWAAELAMLIAPPVLLGLAAANPTVAVAMKPMLVGLLAPVLNEVTKKQKEQEALMEAVESFSDEVMSAAESVVDDLISTPSEEKETEPASA